MVNKLFFVKIRARIETIEKFVGHKDFEIDKRYIDGTVYAYFYAKDIYSRIENLKANIPNEKIFIGYSALKMPPTFITFNLDNYLILNCGELDRHDRIAYEKYKDYVMRDIQGLTLKEID